ncbi:MAG: hypothetical protein H0W76_18015 [Pyrinomonadaceae bacterium]|nr:hypothetical protein [Pyrinomonadaceae bacterium]
MRGGDKELSIDDAWRMAAAIERLRYADWLSSDGAERLKSAYFAETNQSRRTYLARAYREVTGEEIVARSRYASD